MRHRERDVSLAIESSRDQCDGTARNNFADKYNTASNLLSCVAPHIEAQIHFAKVAMKREWNAKNSRPQKAEPDQANEGLTFPRIKLGS